MVFYQQRHVPPTSEKWKSVRRLKANSFYQHLLLFIAQKTGFSECVQPSSCKTKEKMISDTHCLTIDGPLSDCTWLNTSRMIWSSGYNMVAPVFYTMWCSWSYVRHDMHVSMYDLVFPVHRTIWRYRCFVRSFVPCSMDDLVFRRHVGPGLQIATYGLAYQSVFTIV